MANQLYGYSQYSNYGGATSNLFSSRSVADQYLSTESSYPGSSRYLSSSTDPLALSLSLSSTNLSSSYSDRAMYYNTTADYSAAATSHLVSQASWPGVDIGAAASAADSLVPGTKRPSDVLYHQTVLGAHNTIGQTEAWFSTHSLAKRPRFESASTLPIYPQRPGERDCAHYMLTRTCKFGDICKFDHPIWVPEGGIPDWKEVPLIVPGESLPERPGEPDCPYFLKTQRCKFGVRCKFNHPTDKMAPFGVVENADVSILPERPSEPPCAFYMKTGKCKFGSTCKFNHPKDIQILSAEQDGGHNGQAEPAYNNDGTTAHTNLVKPLFTPALLHNSKGLPIRPGEGECPFYLKTGSCKYGATCRYSHPDRNVIYPSTVGLGPAIVAPPAAHLNMGVVNPAASILQTIDPRLTHTAFSLGPTVYPQRPGQIECDYYMKTGECKFVERCKFHHPIDRSAPPLSMEVQQQIVKLTLAGLPRREGAIICPYYLKTGTCKYGATCKFDHPPPGEVMALATSQSAGVEGEGNEDGKEAEPVQEPQQ